MALIVDEDAKSISWTAAEQKALNDLWEQDRRTKRLLESNGNDGNAGGGQDIARAQFDDPQATIVKEILVPGKLVNLVVKPA